MVPPRRKIAPLFSPIVDASKSAAICFLSRGKVSSAFRRRRRRHPRPLKATPSGFAGSESWAADDSFPAGKRPSGAEAVVFEWNRTPETNEEVEMEEEHSEFEDEEKRARIRPKSLLHPSSGTRLSPENEPLLLLSVDDWPVDGSTEKAEGRTKIKTTTLSLKARLVGGECLQIYFWML